MADEVSAFSSWITSPKLAFATALTPRSRPGGTDQSILRALSDLMPVIADQSRWDDLTQVCDPSPGLRSAGHARGTRLVPEVQPRTTRVVDIVPAAGPCILYVVLLAMYTLCGMLGCVYR